MSLNEKDVLAAVEEQIKRDHKRLSGKTFEPPSKGEPSKETRFIGYSGETISFFRRGIRKLRNRRFRAGLHDLRQALRKYDQAGPYRQ